MAALVTIGTFIISLFISYQLFPTRTSSDSLSEDSMLYRVLFVTIATAIVAYFAHSHEKRTPPEEQTPAAEQQERQLQLNNEVNTLQLKQDYENAHERERESRLVETEACLSHLRHVRLQKKLALAGAQLIPERFAYGVVTDTHFAQIVWDKLGTPHDERTTISIDQMAGLTGSLYINSEELQDLEGLQYASHLSEITLSGLDSLASLEPIAELTTLTSLSIDGRMQQMPRVTDLSPLAELTGLSDLLLHRVGFVADYRPLAGLSNLTTLRLSNMPKNLDVEPLAHLTHLSDLHLLSMSHFGDLSRLDHIRSITNLTLTGLDEIENLAQLELLPDLTTLSLNRLSVKDFEQIAKLTSLTGLRLWSVFGVENLEPIAHLTRLTSLSLTLVRFERHEQAVMDLSLLASLTDLKTLVLADCYEGRFERLEPIAGLTQLSSLELTLDRGLRDKDLETLAGLSQLAVLKLNVPGIPHLGPLCTLPRLRAVHLEASLGEGSIYGLEDLAKLPALESLTLSGWRGMDLIEKVSMLTGLRELNLSGLSLAEEEDLWPLTKVTELTTLAIENVYHLQRDLTPLTNLTHLTKLTLGGFESIFDTQPLSHVAGLSIHSSAFQSRNI